MTIIDINEEELKQMVRRMIEDGTTSKLEGKQNKNRRSIKHKVGELRKIKFEKVHRLICAKIKIFLNENSDKQEGMQEI